MYNSRNNLIQPMVKLPYRHWDNLIVPFTKDPQIGRGRMDYEVKLMLNEPCFLKASLNTWATKVKGKLFFKVR